MQQPGIKEENGSSLLPRLMTVLKESALYTIHPTHCQSSLPHGQCADRPLHTDTEATQPSITLNVQNMHLSTYPIIQAKQSSIHPHTYSSMQAGQCGILSLLQRCTTGGAMFDNDTGREISQPYRMLPKAQCTLRRIVTTAKWNKELWRTFIIGKAGLQY